MDVNTFRSLYSNENNLYIEDDYDNIIIFDPNKIVASDGKVQDRFVNQENLVYYANLETKIIPRTKLAIGDDFDNPINNTTIASLGQTDINGSVPLNFLKPQNKNYFDTSWSDEYTGLNSKQGKSLNQTIETKNGKDVFKRTTLNYEDTQTLGIKDIKVKVSSVGVPTVDINLIDVRGRTLFEQGDNSIYSVFFNLPYPTFYLTLKGYYGKAVRYQLTLLSFNARFSPENGNFEVSLKLMGRNSAILADSIVAYGKHSPKMFVSNETTETKVSTSNDNGNDKQPLKIINSSKGLDKLKTVYKIYKQKKLIDNDFPEITMEEFVYRAKKYEETVKEKVTKVNKDVINDINSYQKTLNEIKKLVYTDSLETFLDTSEKLIYNNEKEIYYPYLESIKEKEKNEREEKLKTELEVKVELLKNNASFGENKTFKLYDVKNSTFDNPTYIDQKTNINVDLTIDDILKTNVDFNNLTDDNYRNTFEVNYGRQPSQLELEKYIAEFRLLNPNLVATTDSTGNIVTIPPTYYAFGEILDITTYASNSFLDKLNKINAQLEIYRKQVEQSITDLLDSLIVDTKYGLGFKPTIRNVFAVLFAGLDSFYRLMDDYHQAAYDVKNNPERRKYIQKNENVGTDSKEQISGTNQIQTDNSIYPWPQYYVKERQDDGSELYTIKYIGDQSSEIVKNGSYNPKVWPEIEFTEEFIRASLQKETPTIALGFTNPDLVTNLMPVGAIEFPFDPQPYLNSDSPLEFLYEIYDRAYLSTHYSNINRGDYKKSQIDKIISNIDAENIRTKISETDGKTLTTIIKNYTKNVTNFIDYLKATSNNETLTKWQNLINNIYNSDYIKNELENQNEIYSLDSTSSGSLKITGGIPLVDNIKKFLNDTSTNNEYILDPGLFNLEWLKNNLYRGQDINSTNDFYNTTTFKFLDNKKTISSGFDDETTLFQFYNWNNSLAKDPYNIKTRTDLKSYYSDRSDKEKRYLTEGSLDYTTYSGNVSQYAQTTSILNTPYFYNAIEDGVEKSKNNIENPYAALGYLYLNSLPLITTKEKTKKFNGNDSTDLDYLAATLTKYGAIHKVPYAWVLKYGSIWHRYKKFIEEQVDILDDVWKDFDYKKNYDPISQQTTTEFTGTNYNIILQSSVTISGVTRDFMNVGFYPKVADTIYRYFSDGNTISDFNGNYDQFFNNANSEGLKVFNSYISKLYPTGFTPTNINREFQLQNYSTYFDNLSFDKDNYLLIPSMGGLNFNQSEFECINNSDKLTIEMFNNSALFNGSVRSLWVAPQLGYFDNSQIVKPKYNEYLKSIKPGDAVKTFKLGNALGKYSSIEEIFAVFSPDMLDKFEEKFLAFCKPNYSASDLILKGENIQASNTKGTIKNVEQKNLFSQIQKIFKVPKTNVQLTTDNPVQNGINLSNAQIKNFYSGLREFLKFDCVIKLGNPSGFNRYNIKEFRDKKWTGSYNDGVRLPGDGKLPAQTLQNSLTSAPNEWKVLKKYVGEFSYSKLMYANSGSPITDFFIKNDIKFSEENIINFYPIIKLYYKEKLKKPTLTRAEFETSLTNIVNNLSGFNTDVLNETLRYLGTYLNEKESSNTKINSKISGNVTKLEYYSVLKTLNDKWVAGSNFKEKTLFEDFLFFDRANRDIGDKFTIPITEMEEILNDENKNYYALVSRILEKNNFLFFAMPSYINFYGRQVAGEGQGKIEPNLPSALFGTYLDVDYLDSRPKFLCVYVGKPSEYVSSDASYVRFKSDSFDLRIKDTPAKAEYKSGTDLYKVNKVVGFNVDYGLQNQSVFKSVSIDMSEKKNTAESFKLTADLGRSASADKVAQQSVSLYSIYKSRSYVCTVESMGDATIQPTMYFNLRHVPLFHGAYWITEVNHNIGVGRFDTSFQGIRMSLYNLPTPDSLLTSVNKNYLDYYKEIVLDTKTTEPTITNNDPINKTTTGALPGNENSCLSGTVYTNMEFVDMNTTYVSDSDLITYIETLPADIVLKTYYYGVIKTKLYNSPTADGKVWSAPNYNFYNSSAGIKYHPDLVKTISAQTCVTTALNNQQKPQPFFSFNNFIDNLKFYDSVIKKDVGIMKELKDKSTQTNEIDRYADAFSLYTLFKEQLRYVYPVTRVGSYNTAPKNADEIIQRFNDKRGDQFLINDYNRYFEIFKKSCDAFSPI